MLAAYGDRFIQRCEGPLTCRGALVRDLDVRRDSQLVQHVIDVAGVRLSSWRLAMDMAPQLQQQRRLLPCRDRQYQADAAGMRVQLADERLDLSVRIQHMRA